MAGDHRRPSARSAQRHRHRRPAKRWSNRKRAFVLFIDVLLSANAALAVTNWTVGLAGGSNAQGKSAAVSNLTIAASSSPAVGNLLYPGGTGDVVVTITNPNSFPVTITAVNLPTNTTYASAYSDAGLSTPIASCAAGTPSYVSWNFATGSSGTSHTLTSALTVAANGQSNNPLTVTLTNVASMGTSAPAACEAAYFSMPSLTGITATGGAATATTSPATDAWTS